MTIAGVFALTALLGSETNQTRGSLNEMQRLIMDPERTELLCSITYDTVPGKTVYRDLNTGEAIDIWYDKVGRRTLNKKTEGPVEFYVNISTKDTVFGRGRFIMNNYVIKGDDGKWKSDDKKVNVDGDEFKAKAGDEKFKVDGDEIKIKSKDGKAKYEDDKN